MKKGFLQQFKCVGIFIAAGFLSEAAFAQESKDYLKETQQDQLKQLATDFNSAYEQEMNKAVQLARDRGLPIRKELEDGRTVELQGIFPTGELKYYTTTNLDAAKTDGTDKVWPSGSLGLNLTGNGLTAGEWDGGAVYSSHQDLTGRVTQVDGATSISGHATHVAGTIIGAGNDNSAKGMAYEADLDAHDWSNDDAEMATAASNGLLISNHSYGFVTGWSSGTWNGDTNVSSQEDWKFGFYTSAAEGWDQIAHNAPHYLIVKSSGNDRNDDGSGYPPDGPYDCIPPKGNAKNIMTVGAVKDISGGYSSPSDVNLTSFSSTGPADDGRVKPDIVANGAGLYSCGTANTSAYDTKWGTSMSAPSTTGSLLLLQEHYHNLNGNYMRAATLKGLAIHTAHESGNGPGPDYEFGWGLLNTDGAAAHLSNGGKNLTKEATLNDQQTYTMSVYSDGTEPLTATISWTDVPGNPPSTQLDPRTPMLENDLDLRIIKNSNNNHYKPYKLDPTNPTAAATTGDNDVDNVEKVYVASPSSGWYTIEVTHKGNLNNQNDQDFSLLISGASAQNCAATGLPINLNFDEASEGWGAGTGFNNDDDSIGHCWSRTPGQSSSDYFWGVRASSTGSSNTGPNGDHTTDTTNYLYTEGSNGSSGDTAILTSQKIDLAQSNFPKLKFWYHMYGSDMGTLEVHVSNDQGSTWNKKFSVSGAQQSSSSDAWKQQNVDLYDYQGGTIQLRFLGIKGSGYQSDMAIDDMAIESCPNMVRGSESFDYTSIPSCWETYGNATWNFDTNASYGADDAGDHTGNNGFYGWVDGSDLDNGDTAVLTSAPIDIGPLSNPELSFYLFSNNTNNPGDNNTFHLDIYDGSTWHNDVIVYANDSANWINLTADLSNYNVSGFVKARFKVEGTANTEFYNDILVDDVTAICGPQGLPFKQKFSAKYPACWTRTDKSAIVTSTSCEDYSSQHLRLNGKDGAKAETPPIDVSNYNSIYVSYMYRQGADGSCGDDPESNDNIDVDYWNGNQWVNFINYDGNSAPNSFTHEQFLLDSGLTKQFKLRFHMVNGSGVNFDNFNFDDIKVKSNPPCKAVKNLRAATTYDDSTTIAWNTTNSPSSTYQVEYGEQGFNLGAGSREGATDTQYTITNLQPETSYEAYVREICGSGDTSSFKGPVSFTTECIVKLSPHMQSFDANSTPNCWKNYGDENWTFSTNAAYGASSITDHTNNGGNYAWVDGSNNSGGDSAVLETYPIDISNLSTPKLSFYLFSNNTDNPGDNNTLIVDIYDGNKWHEDVLVYANDDPDWVHQSINLSSFNVTGPVKARFTVKGTASTAYYNDILIDDVYTHCGGITLDYSQNFNGGEFPDCWRRSSSSAITVANNCGSYSSPHLQINGEDDASAKTPEIDVDGDQTIEVSYLYRQGSYSCGNNPESDDNITVEYWNGNVWDSLTNYDGDSAPNSFTEEQFTITQGLNEHFKLRFYMENGSGSSFDNFNFDDLQIQQSCLSVTDLKTTATYDDSANIAFQSNYNYGQTYRIQYGPSGFSPGNGQFITSNDTNVTITGLTPNTSYEVYVRENCRSEDSSALVGPVQFSTDCSINNPVSLPYEEGFESFSGTHKESAHFCSKNGANWQFKSDDPQGRLQFSSSNINPNSGNKAASLDVDASGNFTVNDLILQLNMSNYTVSDQIYLAFFHTHYDEEEHDNDSVWIRGSKTEPWVGVYDLFANQDTSYIRAEINLSTVLSNAGQSYSSNFQIRFGQEDNYSIGGVEDGRSFDDMMVYECGGANQYWTGTMNDDWNNGSNWCSGNVPSSSDDVYILQGTPNYPSISSNAKSDNITLESGNQPGKVHVQSGVALEITGNLINNSKNVRDLGDGMVKMTGNNGSQFIKGNSKVKAGELIIENSQNVVLETAVEVKNTLTLNQGIVDIPSNKDSIIIGNDATVSPAGGGNASYVDGKVTKTGDEAFSFPIGDNGKWAKLAISAPSDTSDQFTAFYKNNSYPNTSNMSSPLKNISSIEYWDLSRNKGNSSVNVTLNWKSGSVTSAGITDTADLKVAHWNEANNQWESYGKDGITGNTSAGSITVENISNFSPFTFGSSSDADNPLPVDLLYFNATKAGDHVNLDWATASESMNSHFILQKKVDGEWQKIDQKDGQGTTTERQNYNAVDRNIEKTGDHYYRLKQVDFDGQHAYSEVESVAYTEAGFQGFSMYPNPVEDKIHINFSAAEEGNYQVAIVNMVGQQMLEQEIEVQSGLNHQAIQVSSLSSGSYFIVLKGAEEIEREKFLKRE